MSQFDLHNHIAHALAISPKTIANSGSPENLVSGDIDLKGFLSAEVVAFLGNIDELGGSPVGSAKIDLKLEHADEDSSTADTAGTYSDVEAKDILGATSVTGGIIASTTSEQTFLARGYIGGKRFLRVTLIPTALSNGGPVAAWVTKGMPRHMPQ